MDRPTISLIIPTISRATLARCLVSVRQQQWQAGDEVFLVGDGAQPIARALWEQFGLPGRYLEVPGPSNDWGHSVRNAVMPQAKADYIAGLDDDDEWVPGALATIRATIAENPDRPHMFRMRGAPCHGTAWKTREIAEKNVGTPMFVVPAAGQRWAQYTPRHGGDFNFIHNTAALWPADALVWREEVIALIRPTEK